MFIYYYFRDFLMVFHPQRHQHGPWKLPSPISSVSELLSAHHSHFGSASQVSSIYNWKESEIASCFDFLLPLASFPVYLLHSSQIHFPNALVQTYLLATCNKSPPCGRLIRLFAAHPELLIVWFLLVALPLVSLTKVLNASLLLAKLEELMNLPLLLCGHPPNPTSIPNASFALHSSLNLSSFRSISNTIFFMES